MISVQLALHTLTTHLLASPSTTAVIIDTTGAFDVRQLHAIVLSRVSRRVRSAIEAEQDHAAELEVAWVLDRVQVMRVFDFTGLIEASRFCPR